MDHAPSTFQLHMIIDNHIRRFCFLEQIKSLFSLVHSRILTDFLEVFHYSEKEIGVISQQRNFLTIFLRSLNFVALNGFTATVRQ